MCLKHYYRETDSFTLNVNAQLVLYDGKNADINVLLSSSSPLFKTLVADFK